MDVHAAGAAPAPPRPERGMDAIPLWRAQQEPALVAAALERHSFAVIALGERDARAVRDCAASAREFFQSTPDGGKARLRQSFADAGGEGLVGYNRARPRRSSRPPRLPRRRAALPRVAARPRARRVRRAGARRGLRVARGAAAPPDCAEDELGLVVGPGSEAISSSPFDLMYYPNDAAAAAEPNSTPHVDSPGLATAIPVAGTPGLRVRDARRATSSRRSGATGPTPTSSSSSTRRSRPSPGAAPRLHARRRQGRRRARSSTSRPAMAVAAAILAPQGRRRAPDPPPGD
ncbi:hypothetical protein JL720_7629 [Aureococcus anophagefferens]|nr:hypothetical protein JL720_7629 [Aureococcus anophagefferens]